MVGTAFFRSATSYPIHHLLRPGGRPAWESPELTALNRLPARATFFPCPTPEAARDAAPGLFPAGNPFFVSLDGDWAFRYFPSPDAIPAHAAEAIPAGTDSIPVPSNWTLHGYGHLHYTNIKMPFPNDYPRVPAENPTGLYQRSVRIPEEWAGRRVFLHFGGAESVLAVLLDGRPVGLSKDSRLPGRGATFLAHWEAGRAQNTRRAGRAARGELRHPPQQRLACDGGAGRSAVERGDARTLPAGPHACDAGGGRRVRGRFSGIPAGRH